MTEQVRLSESPSRKMPEGGTILTVGATVGRKKERRRRGKHEYVREKTRKAQQKTKWIKGIKMERQSERTEKNQERERERDSERGNKKEEQGKSEEVAGEDGSLTSVSKATSRQSYG